MTENNYGKACFGTQTCDDVCKARCEVSGYCRLKYLEDRRKRK